jgi:hypothetical protein
VCDRFILSKDRAGIQARANLAFKESLNPFAKSCNWYEIVQRVTSKAFNKDKSIDQVPSLHITSTDGSIGD